MSRSVCKTAGVVAGFAAATLLLGIGSMTTARADNTAACVAKMSSYIAELDQLLSLSNQQTHLNIAPFDDLNRRYFPFLDCDADPLLVATMNSRFLQAIHYNPRAKYYIVRFASKTTVVGFSYRVPERSSGQPNAIWVEKSPP